MGAYQAYYGGKGHTMVGSGTGILWQYFMDTLFLDPYTNRAGNMQLSWRVCNDLCVRVLRLCRLSETTEKCVRESETGETGEAQGDDLCPLSHER